MSISLFTIGKLKFLQCIFYFIGQVSGAALVYLVFWNQFETFDGGLRQITGSNGRGDIFFTIPGKGIPQWNTLIDQMISESFEFQQKLTNGENSIVD